MEILRDILIFLLTSWAQVTRDLLDYYLLGAEPNGTPIQYGVVVLSNTFFFLTCYVLLGLVRDWATIFKLKRENKILDGEIRTNHDSC